MPLIPTKHRHHRSGLFVAALALVAACRIDNTIVPPDEPQGPVQVTDRFVQRAQPKLDLLFVIDDTGSMQGEQDLLADGFADLVDELASRGTDFRLVLLGERFREVPGALARLERDHSDRILHSGFAASRDDYLAWLDRGHLVVSTARHEFFGLSTLEALRRDLLPILPDDLAYPELLPPEHRDAPWLYPRPEGADGVTAAADAVQAAAELLRANEAPDLTAPTSSLRWEHLAPRYDALLEAHGTDTNGPVPAP